MTTHEPTSFPQALTVGVVGNAGAWAMQDTATLFAMFLSIATTIWIILQMIRFLQKWAREDEEWRELQAKRKREKSRSKAPPETTSPGALGD